ncbi:MAG: hypothetical protein DMG22_19920 [Acidobacteria bacterium]|nr:MAG: hypothetical protein DMG22_19920 [Acidobacteriota bacterium]
MLLQGRESSVDLIVVGAEHRPFLESTTRGNTTEKVLRHYIHPVMVAPGRRCRRRTGGSRHCRFATAACLL